LYIRLTKAQRKQNFGLISRSYSTDSNAEEQQWKRFEKHVRSLEEAKQPNESYKVLFLGRHGEGWHNVAEKKYGTKAWDVSSSLHPLSRHTYIRGRGGDKTNHANK